MSDQDDLLHDFLVESKENLDHLDEELLALEADPSDNQLINSIFRRLHTIKGVCGFLDLHKLESVSHAGETLLQALRSNEVPVTDRIVTLLLTLCDAIRSIVQSIEETKTEGEQSFEALAADLLAATKAQSGAAATQELSLEDEFNAILAQREAEASEVAQPNMPVPPSPPVLDTSSEHGAIAGSSVEAGTASGPLESSAGRSTSSETSLRVDVELLDHLMNLAGELVLTRNQILQSTKGVSDQHVRAVAQRLNLVTSELQEGVMKTRMQPINTVWSKFPRVVRDLAISCKKQVRLEMYGKETELDKTLIEAF